MLRQTIRTVLLASGILVSAQAVGQDGPSWVVDGVRFARISPATFGGGSNCSCEQKDRCACQKTDGWEGGNFAPPADTDAPGFGEAAPPIEEYDLLASSYGATLGSMSAAPGMIGDFFGGTYTMRLPDLSTTGTTGAQHVNVPLAGADRRFKIADNNSPFPVDRYFVNYNRFTNALLTADERQANLNRVVFGIEKTFHGGCSSFEIRLPMSNGLNSLQRFNSTADNVSSEFGNIGFAVKRLLYQGPCFKASVGLGFVIPTADNSQVFDELDRLFVTVENDAFYLQPFLGMLWTPNDRLFAQFFMQADFDTTGNTVRFDGLAGSPSGVVQDQTLLFVDVSLGYWLYRNPCANYVTGIAPMLELHHSTTLEDTDRFSAPGVNGTNSFENAGNRLDVLNITGGVRVELHNSAYLTIAGVAPLRDDEEHLFDAEMSVQYVGLY